MLFVPAACSTRWPTKCAPITASRRHCSSNAKRCGEANAFYDPNNDEVIFCYELMQDFIDLYSADIPRMTFSVEPRPTGTGQVQECAGFDRDHGIAEKYQQLTRQGADRR